MISHEKGVELQRLRSVKFLSDVVGQVAEALLLSSSFPVCWHVVVLVVSNSWSSTYKFVRRGLYVQLCTYKFVRTLLCVKLVLVLRVRLVVRKINFAF